MPQAVGWLKRRRAAAAALAAASLGGGELGWASLCVYVGASLGFAALALVMTLKGIGSRHAVGSGIPEMKAILSGYYLERYLSLRTLVCKLVGLTAALGAEYTIGREGPFVHLSCISCVLLLKLPPSCRFGSL